METINPGFTCGLKHRLSILFASRPLPEHITDSLANLMQYQLTEFQLFLSNAVPLTLSWVPPAIPIQSFGTPPASN